MRKRSDRFKANTLLVTFAIILFWALFNYKAVFGVVKAGLNIISPVLIGVVMALILNVPMSAIERNLFRPDKNNNYGKIKAKIKRPVSLVLTILIFLGAIALVLWLVIPALAETLGGISKDLPKFLKNIGEKLQQNKVLSGWLEQSNISKDDIVKKVQKMLNDGAMLANTLSSTVSVASNVIGGLVNFFVGIFFAIYMLMQKERFKNQLYRVTKAVFPARITKALCHVGNLSKVTFSKFLSGQCVEAIILGSLCCIGMTILRFPYAVTIGVLVALTAFIPIVGAFIGIVVGAFLIMVTSFKQAVWFVVFMLILQQIEGNLIYPRVVGTSVGLPPIWVLFAVTVGGTMNGIVGMFVSVPICSVLYCLAKDGIEYLERRRARIDGEEAAEAPQENKENQNTAEPAERIPAGDGVTIVRKKDGKNSKE